MNAETLKNMASNIGKVIEGFGVKEGAGILAEVADVNNILQRLVMKKDRQLGDSFSRKTEVFSFGDAKIIGKLVTAEVPEDQFSVIRKMLLQKIGWFTTLESEDIDRLKVEERQRLRIVFRDFLSRVGEVSV